MPAWLAPALTGVGAAAQLYSAFGGRGGAPSFAAPPPSQLPEVGTSLELAERLRGRGMDIFERPAAPTEEIEALGPILEAELGRVREQKRQAKGSAAAEAERRGLTFSDIALGRLGGIDVGAMQAEQDVRARMTAEAMQERRARESAELGFLMSQIQAAEEMARARERADIARYMGTAEMGLAGDIYGARARGQELAGISDLGQTLAGIGLYGMDKGWGKGTKPTVKRT